MQFPVFVKVTGTCDFLPGIKFKNTNNKNSSLTTIRCNKVKLYLLKNKAMILSTCKSKLSNSPSRTKLVYKFECICNVFKTGSYLINLCQTNRCYTGFKTLMQHHVTNIVEKRFGIQYVQLFYYVVRLNPLAPGKTVSQGQVELH